MGRIGTGRSLKTARAVLRVLRLLTAERQGVRPEDVAELLDKSPATAHYLLNSLCQEGFAFRDARTGRYRLVSHAALDEPPLATNAALGEAVHELHSRTNQRAYAATREADVIVVQEAKGRQGLPKMPNLRPIIRGEAHALALGKSLLADAGEGAAEAYAEAYELRRFTPRTIGEVEALELELARTRQVSYALDLEEYAEGFCCIAAPVRLESGLPAALAISVPARRYEAEGPELIKDVTAVAAELLPAAKPPPDYGPLPASA
jgi:IclR family acetate operon transcriptional repressor